MTMERGCSLDLSLSKGEGATLCFTKLSMKFLENPQLICQSSVSPACNGTSVVSPAVTVSGTVT